PLSVAVAQRLVVEDEAPGPDDPEQQQEEPRDDEGEFDERLGSAVAAPRTGVPRTGIHGAPGARSMSVIAKLLSRSHEIVDGIPYSTPMNWKFSGASSWKS